jgi:hypothetical protein
MDPSHRGDLTPALRTGKPQNETKNGGEPIFATLYSVPERLEQFMDAMSGISAGNSQMLAQKLDFSKYKTLCDVGGATAQLACFVAAAPARQACRVDPSLGDGLDRGKIERDAFHVRMRNLEKKKVLIRKAYEALPKGGAFVAIEALIDDARRENAFGLCMSLNMLIEFGDAFDYTGADFASWCKEAGFTRFETLPLAGPSSAAIAYK